VSDRALHWLRARRNLLAWRPSDAMTRAVVGGLGLVAAGVVVHRPALLLIGAPLLASAVLAARGSGQPSVRVQTRSRLVDEGGTGALTVSIDPGRNAELIAIRMPFPGSPGVGPVHLLPASATAVRTRMRWSAWGEGVDLRPDHLIAGPDALLVFGPVVGVESRRLVLPRIEPLPPGPLPPRVAGLVGVHRSRRPGDGTELRDIRPFQAGDRLRRVDWRVSLRASASAGGVLVPSAIHVRERHAEADADLVLALDTRVDVGAEVGEWSMWTSTSGVRAAGSLDAGVRAATALAATYLRQGDQVGLVDLARPRLSISTGSGRRQLERIRYQLATCVRMAGSTAKPILAPSQVPHGAVVIVLSPFLDDAVVAVAAHAVRRGNLVLAVDLLPQPLRPATDTRWGGVVMRILLTEHRLRLDVLRDHGVAVVGWSGGAELAELLRRARRRGGAVRR
jgi:uncharacterized protein (DUF58 family)